MNMPELSVNTLLRATDNGHLFRILWINSGRTQMYVFNTETLEMPVLLECAYVMKQINEGQITIEKADPFLTIVSEAELTEKAKVIRDKIWDVMENLVSDEPNVFIKNSRGKLIAETVNSTGKSRKVIYGYLKTYWERGKTRNSFLPLFHNCGAAGKERSSHGNKRGRPRKYDDGVGINVDDAVKAIFEKTVGKYYNTRSENTLQYAYDMMIKENYTQFTKQPNGKAKAEPVPTGGIPTIGQFRYWYNKNYSVPDRIKMRKGESKFNLDHRAILGKSDYGIIGPGAKYQIDATIGDIYLVSRFNRADIIGRPVLYFVVDVFSRMVTGMYVGLEGPSWTGIMMAIANAASDKVKYCAEYGVEITEAEWPCHGIPGAILGDRGELESKAADMLANALNIRVENAPPYRADMKGIVEQHFNTINGKAVAFLPGHVKKDDKMRGGRDYRLDAKLDMHQLTKIMIQCVLHHNNHHLLEGFERTTEMIADNIAPIPLEMWNWGIANRFGALRSFPEETVKLALMPADTASVTAKGIRFKGLYYLCERAATEHWFETARAKGSWKVDISYDPRNMSSIYIREQGGDVDVCWLSQWQEKYQGKCLYEIDYLHKSEKQMQRNNAPKEMASKAELSAAIDDVISEAEEMARQTVVPKSKSERTKDIRDNRRNEKEANRQSEVFTLEEEPEEKEAHLLRKTAPSKDDESISPMTALIKKMQDERFNERS